MSGQVNDSQNSSILSEQRKIGIVLLKGEARNRQFGPDTVIYSLPFESNENEKKVVILGREPELGLTFNRATIQDIFTELHRFALEDIAHIVAVLSDCSRTTGTFGAYATDGTVNTERIKILKQMVKLLTRYQLEYRDLYRAFTSEIGTEESE